MKRTLSALVLLLTMLSAMAQVNFKVSQKQVSDTEFDIVFTANIDKGWHVYAIDETNGPIPASFHVDKKDGVQLVGSLKPGRAPIKHYEDMFGAEVKYYENTVSFSQRVKITGKKYSIEGYLEYGACNDEACLPPTPVEYKFAGNGPKEAKEEVAVEEPKAEEVTEEPEVAEATTTDSTTTVAADANDLYKPVISELEQYADGNGATPTDGEGGLLRILLLGLLGGFVALVTPCVWPIIPMTVSFFLKRNKDDRKKGITDAITYGISIIVIYLILGLAVTMLFGASALNALSTNAVFNIFFCLLLVLFGASFLGGFELTLPSKWTNAVDSKASSTSGLLSIFLMAFTLVLVSFSCTGPIIGFLLVEMATEGNIVGPAVGMFGFALALALPFTLFAIFPAWLKSAPKSGNWMNQVKVTLGFVELAFSLKFLSVADLAYGWHILDREVFLSIWIILFAMLGAYLMGWIRFPHDEEEYDEMGNIVIHNRVSIPRFALALAAFSFAIYMVPGLWGAPCKAVSAFAPPMNTQDFNLQKAENVEAKYLNYEEGMAYAAQVGKPVMIDFTGFGCVNCRKMEAAVWTNDEVKKHIEDDYVLIQLFVDDKTPLPEIIEVNEQGQTRKLRTIGDKWSYLQRTKFGANTQPFYVLLDNAGHPLNGSRSYDEDIPQYLEFLETGLKNYKK